MTGACFRIYEGIKIDNKIKKSEPLSKEKCLALGVNIKVEMDVIKRYANELAERTGKPIIVMMRQKSERKIIPIKRGIRVIGGIQYGSEQCIKIALPDGTSMPCESLIKSKNK